MKIKDHILSCLHPVLRCWPYWYISSISYTYFIESMAKQRQTTKSSKRYRYSSFKFAAEIEHDVQTLPQILYHDKKIFNSLVSFINFHDEFSLQPLLDLLAQFCHDLGPDFLKFYEEAIKTLINLLDAAIEFESSNVFEWGFNCLAYIFKYLSKFLVKKLVLTCDLLFIVFCIFLFLFFSKKVSCS